ncbi:hypothetical protein KIN20_000270 [Parelaphostrongylus tenuis]|uniref:Lipid-binding serum glycoprotein C-terminal domain-containing protein n=1 Tax=Parelaphostrongylus tenuis TaxID=148309 RepID=A0AAD5MAZ8_PARTN|nr:hypothetical protein KIN20_000270 [Parelaphostrongylus tenuis]
MLVKRRASNGAWGDQLPVDGPCATDPPDRSLQLSSEPLVNHPFYATLSLSRARLVVYHHFSPIVAQPAIRVRLNKGVFDQASTIVAGLVEHEGSRITISPSQLCFLEGCVQIHSFRMTSFRQPFRVTFNPYPPNRFIIRIIDFDFFVTGQLSGTIFPLIPLPIFGTVLVYGAGISATTYMDIHRTSNDEPYFRMLSCNIDGGIVDAKVTNMGLITDLVNIKYHEAMSSHSKAQLEIAICMNIFRLTETHFSSRLSRIPRRISISDLFKMFLSPTVTSGVNTGAVRSKRTPSDYYDDLENEEGTPTQTSSFSKAGDHAGEDGSELEKILNEGIRVNLFTTQDITNAFNLDRLQHVWVDLTLLDAGATHNDFSVGMSGAVSNTKTNDVSPYHAPFPFRLPQSPQQRMMEIIISNYTLNSVLYHAHRSNSLMFHVDSRTPGLGSLLKTTCKADEVCLSDQVEELGEAYPNKTLQLTIRTTGPPVVNLQNDMVKMSIDGRCLFFLEDTKRQIGVIPFSAELHVQLRTLPGSLLIARTWITKLTFNKGIEFFGLSARDLDGLRKSTQKALENIANAAVRNGIPLSASQFSIPLQLSDIHISILPSGVFLQANADLYSAFYNHSNFA